MIKKVKSFFSFGKRGDANMWWIIIGAVIALVVLIVLLVIFIGKSTPLERGLLTCEGKGDCSFNKGEEAKCTEIGGYISLEFNCKDQNKICCFKPLVTK